jgi:hypothetical protein
MAATEIAKVLKISDRSVRRWKIKLDDMKSNPEAKLEAKRDKRKRRSHRKPGPKRHLERSLDNDLVERARVLIENGEAHKEISEQLQLPMYVVRRVVKLVMEGASNQSIDDSLRGHTAGKAKKPKSEVEIKREERGGDDDDDDDDFWNQNLNEMKWGESSSDSNSDSAEEDDDTPLSRIGERVKRSIKSKKDEGKCGCVLWS